MTLAAILMIGMICSPRAARAPNYNYAPQSASTSPPQETSAAAGRETAPAAQNPPAPSQPQPAATPGKTPAGKAHTAAKRHKKKASQPCGNAPTASQTAPGSAAAAEDSAATATPPATGSATPCAPSKVIVRQGGTSEPSIQLAGGAAGDQTAHQRDAANQILGSADANLKKIAGRQLSSNQQDMVNQIRQFMSQSREAIDAGDLERARALAWKAQLLSEELVKPEQ